jgi:hypothetical protein
MGAPRQTRTRYPCFRARGRRLRTASVRDRSRACAPREVPSGAQAQTANRRAMPCCRELLGLGMDGCACGGGGRGAGFAEAERPAHPLPRFARRRALALPYFARGRGTVGWRRLAARRGDAEFRSLGRRGARTCVGVAAGKVLTAPPAHAAWLGRALLFLNDSKLSSEGTDGHSTDLSSEGMDRHSADLDSGECVPEVSLAAVKLPREALLQASEALAPWARHFPQCPVS